MTRPLCPFLRVAKHKRTGDTNDEANFVCAETKKQKNQVWHSSIVEHSRTRLHFSTGEGIRTEIG